MAARPEIEMTADRLLLFKEKVAAAADDSEASTAERRVATKARSPTPKQRGDAAAPNAPTAASETHISSLGDDLTLEIFLCLPSLATLIRAAYTCRSWLRAVASSPSFRRRFRATHPRPLLGYFDNCKSDDIPSFPIFVPARLRDRDLAAAFLGGDFFFTYLQDRPEEFRRWEIQGICSGNVLLQNSDDELLAVLNPLSRQRDVVLDHVPQDILERDKDSGFDFFLFSTDEDCGKFSLAFLDPADDCLDNLDPADDCRGIHTSIFSSETGVWSVFPSVEFPLKIDPWYLDMGSAGENGFFYWICDDRGQTISLDTATMKFSTAKLPPCSISSYDFNGNMDSAPCLVYLNRSNNLFVLTLTRDDHGVERWVEDKIIPMDAEFERLLPDQFHDGIEFIVYGVWDGYAYFTTWARDVRSRWLLSLCLETMKVEKLFQSPSDRHVHLYFMAWPPSLLGKCDQPKQVRPFNQQRKGNFRQHHHAADKDAGKKHHHLDVNTLRGHTDSVTALHFSDDGRNLATVCADGAVRIFRIDDTSSKSFKILRIDLPAGAHPTAVVFSEGSSSVVVAAQALLGSSLYMYADVSAPPTAANKQQGKLSPPEIKWSHKRIHGKESVLNFAAARATYGSGDGRTIIISRSEATDIKIWHGKSGKELGTVDTNQLKNYMADISPNGRFIAAAAFTADVKVWEIVYSKDSSVKEVDKVMQLKGHKSAVTSLCFVPNSEQIVTASKDGTIRVWNINVRYHLGKDPKTLRVFTISLHDSKGSVCQYDHMSISPDGKVLAVTSGSTLQWLCVETGAVLDTAEKAHKDDITGIAWAPQTIPNGGVPVFVLASSGVDKRVKLWLAPEVRSA